MFKPIKLFTQFDALTCGQGVGPRQGQKYPQQFESPATGSLAKLQQSHDEELQRGLSVHRVPCAHITQRYLRLPK